MAVNFTFSINSDEVSLVLTYLKKFQMMQSLFFSDVFIGIAVVGS